MNASTAETLLRCYRPGRRADPRLEKAVRLAESDADLRKLLEEQTRFDEQIVQVIHFIKPPEDLRQKLSELSAKPRAEKTRLRWQVINPAVLTAVLGVLLIVGIIVFLVMERMAKFPGREAVESMLGTVGKMTGSELEKVASPAGQLGDWFYMHGYEGYEAPGDLAALPVIRSRIFRFDGRTVAQLLVGVEDAENPNAVRCLIFEFHASEFGVQLPPDSEWRLLTRDDWVGALRQHGDHCFLITFRGDSDDMRAFLITLTP